MSTPPQYGQAKQSCGLPAWRAAAHGKGQRGPAPAANEQEVLLTFESSGVCEFLLDIPDFGPYPVACTWSSSDDELEISDTECEGEGYGAGDAGALEALAHGRWELELEEVEEP